MDAFKEFPETEQQKLYCSLYNVNLEDVEEFKRDPEGCLVGCKFKNRCYSI